MIFFKQFIRTNLFKKLLIAFFFIASGITWCSIWIYHQYYVSTDNAYLNANVVQIASRISGIVTNVFVKNNQYVKKGDSLFSIDYLPYQMAVDAAQAELNLSYAELDNAKTIQTRTLSLVTKKFLSQQEGDNAVAQFKIATAKVAQAKAKLAQTILDRSYTNIIAPTSGWVSSMTLQQGDVVTLNQPLFALISDNEFWVDANFKETEMAAIKPGQAATIVTDLYPDHTFNGMVDSISGGAGTAFSLLPPQNASGNWVKVTQRIPVRIRVLNPTTQFPLRIGISATVTVHLQPVTS